jgi:hypothetical protein
MSITVALLIYCTLIGMVSSLMTYYFKVMRPREEAKFGDNNK